MFFGSTTFTHSPQRRIGTVTGLFFLIALVCIVTTPDAAAGVVIHSSAEVLADMTVEYNGKLYFRDAHGRTWELITSIDDPDIRNPGDGRFHAADERVVREAIDAIQFPVNKLTADVYILPYPRRGLLKSSSHDNVVYISPGVIEYPETQLHSVTVHELGHVVHNYLMPEGQSDWERYRSLRSIDDENRFHNQASHADRPHEIFAEDFRMLFGGSLANYSNSIENPALPLPTSVPGLERFFFSLISEGYANDLPRALRLSLFPNPTFQGVSVEFVDQEEIVLTDPAHILVFDVQGRMVARESFSTAAALTWDGYGPDGSKAAPGIYFVKVVQSAKQWTGKLVIAR